MGEVNRKRIVRKQGKRKQAAVNGGQSSGSGVFLVSGSGIRDGKK